MTTHAAALFSRRDLLNGVLIAGFNLAGPLLPRLPGTTATPAAAAPDPAMIDSWIAIHADNTATVFLGKCELGQGATTGLLQIAGEELDLDMNQLTAVRLDTDLSPNQGATTSSSSIHRGGPQVRVAAAEARQALLLLASARLGVQPGSLTVSKGVVSIAGEPSGAVSYGDLIGDKSFNVKFTGTAPQKPVARYRLVGTRAPRIDIPDKVAGTYVHMQHVYLPGMLHGRVVRPRGQRAYGAGARPLYIDEGSIAGMPVRVVRRGDFVGVVAEREWDAVKAGRNLKINWEPATALPGNAELFERMHAARTTDTVVADIGDIDKGFAAAAHTEHATYRCPYQAHAPFAPNCALADVGPGGVLVMSSTQDIYNSRDMLARVLGLPVEKVRVQYYEGSGTFGHSCYEDAAQAAAILSQEVGRPVRVQFMRWDEHGWDNYGPAHLAEVRAAIDAVGRIIAYEYQGWQHGWIATENSHELALVSPPAERASGAASIPVNRISTGSMYTAPNRRVVSHVVPMLGLLRGAALRSPLDMSFAFASEQTIDALAHAAGIDPLTFRRRNIADPRWLGGLTPPPPRPAGRPASRRIRGRAMARSRSGGEPGLAPITSPMAPRWPRSRSTGTQATSSSSGCSARLTPDSRSIRHWSKIRLLV
jgi:CO/xanthine dehydrogenase Mo-binding subunit